MLGSVRISMAAEESKKRKRRKGPFVCQVANCGKVFSRSDHLARHQVGHSSQRLVCDFEGCGKIFTRIDVKKKHEATHRRKSSSRISPQDSTTKVNVSHFDDSEPEQAHVHPCAKVPSLKGSSRFSSSNTGSLDHTPNEQLDMNINPRNMINVSHVSIPDGKVSNANNTPLNMLLNSESVGNYNRLDFPLYGNVDMHQDDDNGKTENRGTNKLNTGSIPYDNPKNGEKISTEIGKSKELTGNESINSRVKQAEVNRKNEVTVQPDNRNAVADNITQKNNELVYSTEMIEMLLGNTANVSAFSTPHFDQLTNGAFQDDHEEQIGRNPLSILEEIFALPPNFPSGNCQTEIDDNILYKMIHYIPELENNPDFIISKIKWFLELYWSLYHCQYPILHKPSFSTYEAPPLLLLSLIMMGSSFAKKVTPPPGLVFNDPSKLAMTIAEPLRWLIFSCDKAKPPCKAWVIQSLIILETYEITSSSISLHQRAGIYNGTKIQLLRRSPILGGDPFKSFGYDTSKSANLWNTWIESESMKRAALMCFNIDTVHAVVFGHPMNIFANQIKLSLPCPDDIWEYKNFDKNKAPYHVTETPLFLDALRSLLKGEPVNVDSFGRHIILSGLINLVLQTEQNVPQWSSLEWKTVEQTWKDDISTAIRFWKTQLPQGNCCLTLSSVYYAGATSPPLPPSLMPEDTRCKFPVYHAAQIYLQITHYDYMAFVGAPKRMNVPILPEDYTNVVRRIDKWSKSLSGRLSVINSLILLFEMLLSPEGSVDVINYYYEPDKDPFIYRPNVIISAILSLWTYAFHLFGPESSFNGPDLRHQLRSGFVPAMEDGSYYLRRIRSELVRKTGISFSSLSHMDPSANLEAMKEFCKVLPRIPGLHHLIGLLKTLQTSYLGCEWQVGRQYSRLLGNCIKRSAGATHVFCTDDIDDV